MRFLINHRNVYCARKKHRPVSSVFLLFTVLALLGLVLRSSEMGLFNRSFSEQKLKQENKTNTLYFELEEEGDETNSETAWYFQTHNHGTGPFAFLAPRKSHLAKNRNVYLNTKKPPQYILNRSLII